MDNNQKQENDDLNDALDGFNNDELNLTNEQQKVEFNAEDPQTAAKIKEQYEKFMNEMKNLGGLGGGETGKEGAEDAGFDDLTNMLGGLLKNLTEQAGMGGDNDIGKGFEEMFKNLKDDNMQDAAGKLLKQFMNKDLLYEPLLETKENYESYFKKQEGKIPKADLQRYNKQFQVVKQIIKQLQEKQQDQDKLIELFEKMQQHGSPPEGIASTASFM